MQPIIIGKEDNTMAKTTVKTGKNENADQKLHSVELPLAAIWVDHEFNARKKVTDKEGEEEYEETKNLAEQIKRDGQLSPVLVREIPVDDREGLYTHELIYGFRRYSAMQMLKRDTIVASVWQGNDVDAYFVNLAENVSRKSLKPYEKAERYLFMKSELEISGREIAKRLGENAGHVNNLIRIVEQGHPKLVQYFREGHAKATTDALARIVKKDSTHEQQWEGWLKHLGLEDDLEDSEEEEGEAASEAADEKIRRPGKKHLEAALAALKDCDKDPTFIEGARAALRWALGYTKTLPGIYNPAKPPQTSTETE